MKGLAIIVFVICMSSMAEAAPATDCNACQSNLGNSVQCNDIKTYISCLIDTFLKNPNLAGCTNIKSMISNAKSSYDTSCNETQKTTSSCLCEIAFHQTEFDCTAFKAKLTCLLAATGVGCDGNVSHKFLITSALVDGKMRKDCILDTCECEAIYTLTEFKSDSEKCTALKTKLRCLEYAIGISCDGTKRADELAVAADLLIEDKTSSKCRTDLTDTCICQITYAKTDTTKPADKCTALKKKIHCFEAATAVGCDGTSKSNYLAAKDNNLIVDGDGVNCKTDLTDTCSCQIKYAIVSVKVEATKCTELKKKMHCLADADGVGCDGTSSSSTIANSADKLIVNNCRNDLTKTCECAINYAKTDATTTAAKCKAAKVVQECLTKITDTADKACDDTTLVGPYLNETMVPKVTTLCNDAASLNGVGLALGILLMFQEMARQI